YDRTDDAGAVRAHRPGPRPARLAVRPWSAHLVPDRPRPLPVGRLRAEAAAQAGRPRGADPVPAAETRWRLLSLPLRSRPARHRPGRGAARRRYAPPRPRPATPLAPRPP